MDRKFDATGLFAAIAFAVAVLVNGQPAKAFVIQEITSSSGIGAWLVEDYTNPIITIAASFKGGAAQDPDGKAGMASLMSSLFDEGAGPYDSKEFQARLEKLGVELSFRDRRDQFSAVLQTLKFDSADAFEMMRLSLTELHFDENAIGRMRNALKARLLSRENRPRTRAAEALRQSLFGGHPYSRSSNGTIADLDRIERAHLVDHFSRLFARDNLTVGIVGAVSREEAAEILDLVFGELPRSASLAPIAQVTPAFGESIDIEEDSPQTTITMALPGVARDSEKFFAAYLMNHILGGGTFSSRLYNEVREKRGLAYSIYSDLVNYDHASFLTLGTTTRADREGETLDVMRGELEKMAREGPTAAELDAAKRYVIGAYAINNLDTSPNIAGVLVAMQEENLGIDYLQRREELINSVTLDQVRSIARELLSEEPTVIVVGPTKS